MASPVRTAISGLCTILLCACTDDGAGTRPDASADVTVTPPRDVTTDTAAIDIPRDSARDVPIDTPATDGRVSCPDNRVACAGVCCAAGTSCAGGFCCAETERCGGVCCGPNRRCEGGTCALDCRDRVRCGQGAAAVCCNAGQVCYLDACTTPGSACNDLTPCATGQYCEPTLMRCLPRPASTEACEYRPPASRFTPRLKWSWSGDNDVVPTHNQVMMQPAVANLTDDNRDGRIDRNDIPDVVFSTFGGSAYTVNGVLRAISGADGSRLWPTADPDYRTTAGASVAIAELDATSPGPEIVTCSESVTATRMPGHVLIVRANGQLLRRVMNVPCMYSAPAIGDMDNDGVPEIAVRNLAFHADGTLLAGFRMTAPIATYGSDPSDFAALADMDGNGSLELVLGNSVTRADGTTLWQRANLPNGMPDLANGTPAVADLDRDGRPEVVMVQSSQHALYALNGQTGQTVWGPIEINRSPVTSGPNGGGPPTIADFNGDGTPDVATAGGYNYIVVNGRNGAPFWSATTQDTSSRVTGSSVFDFEGDGRAEVIYNDELLLRVYRGTDGMVLFNVCNTSGTLWEYPVIVDVDRDDSADIVVMANNYGSARLMCADGSAPPTGIRVYSDPTGEWVRTRSIWNQHTYHVTNIDDDGRVPQRETANWTVRGLNNFRQNVQPDGLFDAPDLVPVDLAADNSACPARLGLRVRVINRGRAGAPPGVPVVFFQGSPTGTRTVIGRAVTTRRLLPGESEVVSVRYDVPMAQQREAIPVFVVVNDAREMPLATLHECRTNNNTLGPQPTPCTTPG
jgi:hypothetical protein